MNIEEIYSLNRKLNEFEENYIQALEENQELKKQLEDYKKWYQDELEENAELSDLWINRKARTIELENQQTEFIKCLEKEIIDSSTCSGQQYYARQHLKLYQEIIGEKDE